MQGDRGAIGSGSDRSQTQTGQSNLSNQSYGLSPDKIRDQFGQQSESWDKLVVLGYKNGTPHLFTNLQDERRVTEMIRQDFPTFSKQLETQ